MSVIVVGAGIVGLSTAWALARRGRDVTLIERGPIPNPLASSTDHHRLIRYAYPKNPGYSRRVDDAFAAWDRLWADLVADGLGPARRYFIDRGILTLSRSAGDPGDRARALFDRDAIPYEPLEGAAAIAERCPFLEPGNLSFAMISKGGALMANRILTDLADHLRRRGVRVLELSPVVEIEAEAGRVRLADGRVLEAETVVATAGAGLPGLLPETAGHLGFRRTLIVYAEPPEELAEAWADAPCWSGLGDERELWGMSPVEGLGAKLGCGALRRLDPDDTDRQITPEETEAVLSAYRGRFRRIEDFRVTFAQANYWMLAPEERFFLARRGRVLAASACSGHGFKFGALSGEDIAEAVAGPASVEQVAARMAATAI